MTTYQAVHGRLLRERGAASEFICSCGDQAAEWAYQKKDGSKFSTDLDDYAPMCRSCHRKFDRASYVENGKKVPAEVRSANGRMHAERMAKVRRKCSGCEMVSHPVGIGRHQKASGHTGWEELL